MNRSLFNQYFEPVFLWRHTTQMTFNLLLMAFLLILSGDISAQLSGNEKVIELKNVNPPSTQIKVVDDGGNKLVLSRPARRIISLAPHITEMLFSAGAGDQIVGAAAFSDFPMPAKSIPRVGDSTNLDFETIVTLQPDLVVVWPSGVSKGALQKLRELGFQVYLSEPRGLYGIAENISDFGLLTGHSDIAQKKIRIFKSQFNELDKRYRSKSKITVFYQIWQEPLMTINGRHLISQVIDLCGGTNVFANLPTLAPQVELESVMARDAQVILMSAPANGDKQLLAYWHRWQNLQAVREQQIYTVPWDLISRHSLRILDGAKIVCEAIERTRRSVIGGGKTPSR